MSVEIHPGSFQTKRRSWPIIVARDVVDRDRWQPVYSGIPYIVSSARLGINEDLRGYETRQGAAEAARELNDVAGRCSYCGAKVRR